MLKVPECTTLSMGPPRELILTEDGTRPTKSATTTRPIDIAEGIIQIEFYKRVV